MLLDTSREVKAEGLTGSHAFRTTENSSKLFAMLSNMLYKDKERSVLTELSSNAVDAHKLVGKESDPIEVTLPTQLVPEIRIRDFGLGLSEDQVVQFLTTYGESSKQGSNDFIGGFGIGSKSPAAVTDTWTVHSYHQGVHKQYLVYVSAQGVPSLTKITEKATTESGLEVIVPVKKERINTWIEAAKKTYLTYSLMPRFKNSTFKPTQVEWKFTTSHLATSPTYEVKSLNTSALINGRLYPLDTSKIDGITVAQSALLKIGAVLKFNIGDLSLNLSREDLQYDARTIKAIKAKLDEAWLELVTMWKAEVDDKSTDQYEYFALGCTELTRWFDDCNYSGQYSGILYEQLGVGCKNYSKTFSYSYKSISFDLKGPLTVRALQKGSDKVTANSRYHSSFYSYEEPHPWQKQVTCSIRLNLQGLKEIVFVEDDKASYINLRVREQYGINSANKCNVLIAEDFSFLPNFLQAQVIKASALPKPVITKAKRGLQVKSEYYRIVGNQFRKEEDTYFNQLKRVAYVMFKSANTTGSIEDDFKQYVHHCDTYGITIVGIKEGTAVPAWAKHPKDMLREDYDDRIKKYDDICKNLFYTRNKVMFEYYSFAKIKRTGHASKWNEFVDTLASVNAKNVNQYDEEQKMRSLHSMANIFEVKMPDDKYMQMENDFFATYPMLRLVLKGQMSLTKSGSHDIVVQYVEMVGK